MTDAVEYRSSVLKCNVEDHDCAVCRFLNADGQASAADMMDVIRVLDAELASQEQMFRAVLQRARTIGKQWEDE